jgi:Lon protease-like protein
MKIPLFPLPGLVLFPHIILPLHIFEDRYKEMINSCIDNHDAFGLILLREGAQEETEQTIHRVGTTAKVVEVERLDGGRLNILCQGEARFRLSRFTQKAPYWKGSVELFNDEITAVERLVPLREQLATLYRQAFELGVRLGAVTPGELRLPDSPTDLSFMVSYILDIEPEQKQKLLELNSTERRLRELLVHVEGAIIKFQQQLAYKNVVKKVHGNGDLGKPGGSY